MQAHRVGEQVAETIRRLGLAHLLQRPPRQVVVAARGEALRTPVAQVDRQVLATAQLPRIGEHRLLGMIGEPHVEIVDGAFQIQPAREARQIDQLLDLGGERHALSGDEVVERLDAKPVAGGEQALALAVVDREGEHAAQPVQRRLAPGRTGLQQHFAVRAGGERHPRPTSSSRSSTKL